MKKTTLYGLFVVFALGFYSCETDIDVNADFEDIPVVVATIDPAESTHYIKITKAFLQDGVNAIDLAADADNFNYGADELDVVVEEYTSSNVLVNDYTLTRTENEIIKDPGIFDNSTNVLYKFDESAINQSNTYRLKIFNKTLSKEISAETEIVKDIVIVNPNNQSKTSFFSGTPSTGNYTDQTFEVRSGADVGRIAATLIFNYTEHYTAASGLSPVQKSIRMSLGEKKTTSNVGDETFMFDMSGEIFFGNVTSNTSSPSSISFFSHRELDRLSVEFTVAGTELNTFMEVSEPSNNVNQEKPAYTNIVNGLGIFSSRTKTLVTSTAGSGTSQDINLTSDTMRKLNSLGLGFCFGITTTTSLFGCP